MQLFKTFFSWVEHYGCWVQLKKDILHLINKGGLNREHSKMTTHKQGLVSVQIREQLYHLETEKTRLLK